MGGRRLWASGTSIAGELQKLSPSSVALPGSAELYLRTRPLAIGTFDKQTKGSGQTARCLDETQLVLPTASALGGTQVNNDVV